jgi:hypothetical protein
MLFKTAYPCFPFGEVGGAWSLQLRVQLRILTGFPLDAKKHHHIGDQNKLKMISGTNILNKLLMKFWHD